jgi:hypothetical protein
MSSGYGGYDPNAGLAYVQQLLTLKALVDRNRQNARNPNPQTPNTSVPNTSQFTSAPRSTGTIADAFQTGRPPPGSTWNTANVRPATAQGADIAHSMGLQDTNQRVGAGAAGEQKTMSGGQMAAIGGGISGIGSAISGYFDSRAQNAMQAARNIANIKSEIPGPENFRTQAPNIASSAADSGKSASGTSDSGLSHGEELLLNGYYG